MRKSDIAVIGVACYYPGASNVRELWENILARRVQFRRMLDKRLPLSEYYDADPKAPEKMYLTKAAFLENFDFDWEKLRIPKKVVESTDIAHWLALDIALKTFEDAGYKLNEIPLQNTGVIVGNTLTGEQTRSQTLRLRWPYVQKALNASLVHSGVAIEERGKIATNMEKIYKSAFYPITEDSLAGGLANTIAGRICNYLNLKGGGYIVDGACSSSLLAVATAANALKLGDSDLVLAGGVDISLDPFELVGFAKAGALAKDQMRVYDQRANGFLPGEGCGFVLLKRLEDAVRDKNYIYATIKGWGISSDGKGGIMEPSSSGQSFAIGRAYKDLDYKAGDVNFIEGHGTGTAKGDRVELEGIAAAVDRTISKKNKGKRICGVTSFKSIVGHTKAAAGIGGLIKAILGVNQRILPPTANCTSPNEVFKDKAKHLYPLIQGGILGDAQTVRAGISSAGFGGINCHITVESKDKPKESLKSKIDERALFVSHQETEVFVFSSRTIIHLKKIIQRFKPDLRNVSIAELADLASLLNRKVKSRLPIKVSIVTDTPEHLYDALVLLEQEISTLSLEAGQLHKIKTKDTNTRIFLSNNVKKARVGFLYPGQGSQRLNMTRTLVERFKWARDLLDLSKAPLAESIYKATDKCLTQEEQKEFEKQLSDTKITQPAVIVSSLIWTEFLSKLGVEPTCVAGHSLGELTAFYKAGAFDKETLVKFSDLRGRLMSTSFGSTGSMASLFCSKRKAEELIGRVSGNIIIANINSPNQIIVSGGNKEIEKIIELAKKQEISAYRLNVSNAFHSSFMKPASAKINSSKILPDTFKTGPIKIYSCVSGEAIQGKVDLKEYFSKQMVSPVYFTDLVEAISKDCDVLIEVGPGRVLTDLVKAINKKARLTFLPVESMAGSSHDLNMVLAQLFVRNADIQWQELYKNRLIKTFVPASKKKFIENQCERPLRIDGHILKEEFLGASILGDGVTIQEEKVESVPIVRGKDAIADLLIDLTHKITGFDIKSITSDLRLLDDLNLDSIKAAELIGQAARTLGIAGQLDPSQLSNHTLGQIRDRLHEVAGEGVASGGIAADNVLKRYQDKSWVRNFVVELKSEEITARNVNQLKGLKNIVFWAEKSEEDLVNNLKVQLEKINGKIEKSGHIDCLIAVLPPAVKEIDEGSLKVIMEQLHQITDLANSNKMKKDSFVVFVGFGSGDFSNSYIKSLASTLYLERPDLKVRVIDFDIKIPREKISSRIIDELQTYEYFNAVGYSFNLLRKVVYYENSQPVTYKKRNISWSSKDVVLVTGGAKGITAQCALAFAKSTKAHMVLIGRSPAPNKKDETNEIIQTIKQFERERLKCSYYQCDVTNKKSVSHTIAAIEKETGKVTGVVHGAGLNSLKRLKQASVQEAFQEALPKVMGAVNICNVLKSHPPKMIVGITSIIGLTGMEGSGWYGLANEILNYHLHQFKAQHPKTDVLTIAYSVWDEVGMGAKLGSVSRLAEKGIGSIPVEQGVKRFRQLVENDPGTQQVIVAARVAGIETWKSPTLKTNHFRFVESVEYIIPGVELIAQASLNVKDDPYLLDHNWKGSLLFPFVFGFEAMAQAVAYVLGVEKFDHIKARNINLQRPISVPREMGTLIEIHAEVLEEEKGKEYRSVKVEIYSQETAYKEPHFSATFEIALKPEFSKKVDLVEMQQNAKLAIDLDIQKDIYGPILFQGELFQGIEKIYNLNYSNKSSKGECLFATSYYKSMEIFLKRTKKFRASFLTGDPFFIDSLLQSVQLIITPNMALPNFIEEISLEGIKSNQERSRFMAKSYVNRIEDEIFVGSATAHKDNFYLNIKNCRLKVIEYLAEKPSANDLFDSREWNQKIIEQEAVRVGSIFNIVTSDLKCFSVEGLEACNKVVRQKIELPFIKKVLKDFLRQSKISPTSQGTDIIWSKSGKPMVKAGSPFFSLSHEKDMLVLSVGDFLQGCDVETVSQRTDEGWLDLLGQKNHILFREIKNKFKLDMDYIGTSIWCACEAVKKATERDSFNLELFDYRENCLVFSASTLPANYVVAAPLIQFLKMNKKVVSFLGKRSLSEPKKDDQIVLGGFAFDRTIFDSDVQSDNPQKQSIYVKRFPVTFKHVQNLGKSVYFSNYFDWMGDIREYCLSPIMKEIRELMETGLLGMATNSAKIRIINELKSDDVVEVKFWLHEISGKEDAVFDFMFEWCRVQPNGQLEKVAISEQRISWIKITGHGEGQIVRPPQRFQEFMAILKPKNKSINQLPAKSIFLENVSLGKELSFPGQNIKNKRLLKQAEIVTSLVDSNLVGNIYFANYAKWLGRSRDAYFYKFLSDYYKGIGENGEFLCLYSDINHLGEAMPFDTVLVRMFLEKVYEKGMDLNFEFLKEDKNKKLIKLAFARHTVVWTKKYENQTVSEPIPQKLLKALLNATQ